MFTVAIAAIAIGTRRLLFDFSGIRSEGTLSLRKLIPNVPGWWSQLHHRPKSALSLCFGFVTLAGSIQYPVAGEPRENDIQLHITKRISDQARNG